LKRTLAATPEDVRAAANRWLTAGSYTLVVEPFPELEAASSGADRSKLPETTEFPKASFASFERSNLKNGMELIVANRSTVPMINFSLQFDAGFAADQFSELGTASLAMEMLDEGTKRRDALEISDELAELGAYIGASAGLDSSSVSLNALTENLDASLDIYADIILNPSFPDNELERLRKSRLAQIQQEKNQPIGMALRNLPALLYGKGHAYSAPLTGSGTENSVARINRDTLMQYHKTWFKPNNATMIVVGDTTMAEIKPKLEKLFAGWKPGNVPTKNIGLVKAANKDRVYILDRPDAPQTVIIAGNLAPPASDGNEIAIETMNEIIGGSFTARINMNLREDKHWSYGAQTVLSEAKGQRPFFVYAPVQTDKTKESMAEVKRELVEYLGTKPATEEELAKVKANNTLSLPGRWETSRAIMRDLDEIVSYDLPDNYWDTYADTVRNLNIGQITKAANEVIKPDQLLWVIVGDRAKIEAGIRELELGEIGFLDAEGNPIE
jgi:zinc protease